MFDALSKMSTPGLMVLSGTILVLASMIFVLVWKRGFKASLGGKTLEVTGADGELQQTDQFGLMYILNDNCHQIEERKKERIDSVIPALSYRINEISNLACINLKAESILQNRRRQNGFSSLKTRKAFYDYVDDVSGELLGKTKTEAGRVVFCSNQPVREIEEAVVRSVAEAFALKAVTACRDEYQEKAEMYRRFCPQFEILKDKPRVDFCNQKIKKHEERVKTLTALIEEIEG